ncbi:MAG: acyltransferase family protein [Devosia sp.]
MSDPSTTAPELPRLGVWGAIPTLAATLESRDNNYNAVRLLAAIMVIVSHTFLVLVPGVDVQPFSWAPYNLGAMAVNVFFVLSGVMVSRSFALQPNLRRFVAARLLRIFPGLFVAALVTVLLIGPLAAEVPYADFLAQPAAWTYPFRVLYDFADAIIPYAFTHNLLLETNTPLWTIRYEVLAYAAFALVAWAGLANSRTAIGIGLIGAGYALFVLEAVPAYAPFLGSIVRFAFAFFVGMAAYRFANYLPLSVPLALAGLLVSLIISGLPGNRIVSILAFGYAGLALGSVRLPSLAYIRRHDLSYGLYLYGWPVQQAISHHIAWEGMWLLAHLTLALSLSAILALASWHLVERPALSLKKLWL